MRNLIFFWAAALGSGWLWWWCLRSRVVGGRGVNIRRDANPYLYWSAMAMLGILGGIFVLGAVLSAYLQFVKGTRNVLGLSKG